MRRTTVRILLRSGLTIAGMLALYAVIPVPGQRESLGLTAILALAGLGGLSYAFLALADRARRSTDENSVRLEALVAVLYAFVVFMSLVYLALSSKPGQFRGLHNRIDALYFTMSTIATVGFGDVHAVGAVSRAVVTVQMLLDIVFVGLMARIIIPSVVDARSRSRAREAAEAAAAEAAAEAGERPDVPPSS
jgi:voltage-gated potassium channel Kch